MALPSAAETPQDCYGPTLDLTLRSYAAAAQIWVPASELWTVNIGNARNLHNVPCLPEPVEATSLVHPAAHGLLPAESRAVLDSAGVRLTVLRMSALSAEGIGASQASYDWWLRTVFAEAAVTEAGHLRRPSDQNNAVGGSWLLTERYPDETGQQVRLGCALDCAVEYMLSPSVALRYQLIVQNKDTAPDWGEIDRAVRGMVLGWF